MSDQHPEEPALPDDVWERFARDTEHDIRASAPKEPSARARMVTQRLRQQDAQGVRPVGWRAPPAAARRPRGRAWTVLGLLLALAVAVVAMKPSLIPGDPFGDRSTADSPAELPAETARPSAPPSSAAPDTPTLDHPFAGSPALRWADGESGIVLPPAEAVGSLTKAQVATALQETKTLLVDANLSPKTLLGGRPTAALGVLDPKQSHVLADLDRSLAAPGEKYDPLLLFSRFDPGEVRLVGKVVKVRGRITFARGENASAASVRVHADYTFVYPLSRADSTEVARTIVRRVVDTELADPAQYTVTPGRLQLVRYDESAGNSACGIHDGFLHPQFSSATATGAPAPGPTTDPYDRSRDLVQGDSRLCGTVSRT